MSTQHFVPKIWSTKILRVLEDNLVAKKICDLSYQGQIKKAGDQIYFNGLADPTIGTYGASDISYESLEDAGLALVIDQQKFFAFKVEDIEAAQANVDLKGSQASRAGYKLAETADSFVLGKHADALNTVNGSAGVTSANVISLLSEGARLLHQRNVPDTDIFAVISPWMRLKLQLAGIKFQINNGLNGTGGMAWTKELGFDVYVTNNLAKHANHTEAVPRQYAVAGAYNSMVYAEQIIKTEYMRAEKRFDDLVRGLHVYGCRVVRPDHLVSMDMLFAPETTI